MQSGPSKEEKEDEKDLERAKQIAVGDEKAASSAPDTPPTVDEESAPAKDNKSGDDKASGVSYVEMDSVC